MIEFFIPIVPPTTTAQMHKVAVQNGKPRFYDPPEVREMKATLMAHLAPYAPASPLVGPVALTVKWIWPGGDVWAWKTTKPDTDNIQKALKDCMTRLGFWCDDCQVASEITQKFTHTKTGIYIHIQTIAQP